MTDKEFRVVGTDKPLDCTPHGCNGGVEEQPINWYSAYVRGDRSPKAKEASANYHKNRLRDMDIYSRQQGQTKWNQAARKVEKKGGYVTTDPEEIETMVRMYAEVTRLNLNAGKVIWSIDHVVPITIGGSHCLANIRIIPLTENKRRPRLGQDLSAEWKQFMTKRIITSKKEKR